MKNIKKRIEFWKYLRKKQLLTGRLGWMMSKPRETDKRNSSMCKYLLSHKKSEAVTNWDLEQMAKDFKDYMNRETSYIIKYKKLKDGI